MKVDSRQDVHELQQKADFLLNYGHMPLLLMEVHEKDDALTFILEQANAAFLAKLNLDKLPENFLETYIQQKSRPAFYQALRKISSENVKVPHFDFSLGTNEVSWHFVAEMVYLSHYTQEDATVTILGLILQQEHEAAADETKGDVTSGQLHHSLMNSAILAVGVDEKGCITFANKAMQEVLGEGEANLRGRNLFDEFVPLRGQKLNMPLFLELAAHEDIHENLKRSIQTKSGKLVKLNLTSIIYHDSDGEFSGLTILAENITEQKEVKRSLQTKNKQLAELFNTAFDMIQIFGEDGTILFVNKSWKDKLGYQDDAWQDLNFFDLVHPKYLQNTKEHLEKLRQGKDSNKFQTVLISKSGSKIYISGSITVKLGGKGKVAFRGIFHDISEQLRAERAQNLYNSIANLTIHSPDLDTLFFNIHRELKKVLQAENFSLALIGEDHDISFPYRVSKGGRQQHSEQNLKAEKSLVDYVLSINKPVFLYEGELLDLASNSVITPFNHLPQVWLGVPLKIKDRTIGLLSLQHFGSSEALGTRDLDLLDFVSGQVALAVERKLNEEKLSEQSSRLKAIFDSSTHLIWSVDSQLKLTSFNKNFSVISREQYGHAPVIGEVFNAQKPVATQKYLADWKIRYEEALKGETSEFEVFYEGKDQLPQWFQVFINPIYREDGTIRELAGIAHDISVRKKSELAVLESEEKFRNIFESFQDIYFRCRLDGTITLISPSVKELTEYETYDVVGKNITNYYLYDSRTKNLIRQLVKYKRVRNFEASVIKANGDLMQCICNVRLIYHLSDKPMEVEGVIRDITQLKKTTQDMQKAKELAERSLKVKEGFLANMSHEIRTPMNGVISMIDLLADTPLNEEQEDYVDTIKTSSETLLNILNDILDLSKIEAGKMKLRPTVVSLNSLLEKVHALFYQQAVSKQIDFSYSIQQRLPEYVRMDETRFLQVLSNLTSNALKFTGSSGKVSIFVEEETAEDTVKAEEMMLKISVADSGIGISQESQESLFENFSQVDSSVTKKYGGTGLGLSISKQLSYMMGGNIGVESRLGQGSTFWFSCKVGVSEKPEMKEEEGENAGIILAQLRPRILLVDDNMVNRKVSGQILRKVNCEVTMAASGKEAIELVRSHTFDLILMDIQMPEMDGVVATQAIRALGLPRVPPIVAMTAYSMQGDKEKFVEAGLDDYVSKPIRPRVLISKLAEILSQESKTGETRNEDQREEVINFEVLKDLEKYGGKELIIDTLNDFREEAAVLIKNCSESKEVQDYDDILSKLHTLKGNASTLGLDRLAGMAKSIEARLKEGDTIALEQDLQKLQQCFSEFLQEFNSFLNSNTHG